MEWGRKDLKKFDDSFHGLKQLVIRNYGVSIAYTHTIRTHTYTYTQFACGHGYGHGS